MPPPRARSASRLLLVLLATSIAHGADALSCITRAFGLLTPCQSALGALSASATAADIGATLAALGGPTAPAVTQCCDALRPFSDALCAERCTERACVHAHAMLR
jgi:hypothetical protein